MITSPTQEIVFTPARRTQLGRIIIALVLTAVIIFISIKLSPFFLVLLLAVIAMYVQNERWLRNGSLSVTKDAIISRGSSADIEKELSFKDVHKVVQANPLVRLGYRNSTSAFGIAFVDASGDILFLVWTYEYSKEDIEKLFSLFDKKDTLVLQRASFKDIKKAVTK